MVSCTLYTVQLMSGGRFLLDYSSCIKHLERCGQKALRDCPMNWTSSMFLHYTVGLMKRFEIVIYMVY